jgi:hypothetical protein
MDSFWRLAELNRAHDVRVLNARAERGFSKKARDGGAVLPQLFAQDFQRNRTMLLVGGPVDSGGPAFTDALFKRVSGDSGSSKGITRHGPNLSRGTRRSKRTDHAREGT